MRLNLLILLFPLLFSAQNLPAGKADNPDSYRDIDSLKLVLKNAKHDSTRCLTLRLLAIAETDNTVRMELMMQTLQIAESNLSSNNKTVRLFFLKQKAGSLNNIGVIYQNRGDIPKALDCYHKSLKIKEEIGDKRGIAYSLNNIGRVYQSQGDISKAFDYNYKSLKIREEIGDKSGIAYSLNNIGLIYKDQGDIPKALDYYHKSLKMREEIEDKEGIATSLGNIGNIYVDQGEIPKALEYHHKSLKIREEIGDKSGMAYSLNNIGVIYKDQGDIPKALDYYHKSLKIMEEIGDKYGIAMSLGNIGAIYKDQGNIPKALDYYHKSLKTLEEIGDKSGIATSFEAIGGALLLQGKVEESFNYGKRCFDLAKELGFPERIQGAASLLKSIYQKQNKYKEALEMHELEITMRDSISNEATKKASIKNQLKYEYEKRAAADSVKNAEEQKVKDAQLQAQAASLKQEKTQRYALYGGLVLVAGFLIFVINRFRITNKQKKIIEVQKTQVDEAFEKLHEKNKEVMDSIHYAKRIQTALLPNEKYIQRNLKKLN